ncbi:MAG: alpha/beta hydrolase [Roseococcus sp.]|nr:alpha/beta hydrolase [Roseococcus sp.]
MILLALGGAALVLALGAGLWAFQDHLIYFPDPAPPPSPAALGLTRVEERRITTSDGLELLGWRLREAAPGAPVILYLHGNGGSLLHRARRVQRFQQQGWGALFVQWRGYGGNPGRPDEAGLALDALAGLQSLRAEGVATARIVGWGESLGTGLAIRLAAERPDQIAAVVLESPYTSLLDLARRHYPLLPAGLLLRDHFDSAARIGAVRAPILMLIGDADTLIPPAMSRDLATRATAPLEIWEAPGAGHNELGEAGGVAAAAEFLRRHLTRR